MLTSQLSTREAADMLGVSAPTVGALIQRGSLVATKEPWGVSRFKWRIDPGSVEAYVRKGDIATRSAGAATARVDELEAKVNLLMQRVASVDEIGERTMGVADLRARVVALETSLMHARDVAELQARADRERSEVVRLLLEAVGASERADDLRRQSIDRLNDALAQHERPGHIADLLR